VKFSFILAQSGIEQGLLGGGLYQGFLAASIFTMMLTPFLMNIAPRAIRLLAKLPVPERMRSGRYSWAVELNKDIGSEDQLVIIGYGVNGRNLARAAGYAGIPYVILDINAETVRSEKERGEPIYFGDATHQAVLENIDVQNARVVVIAISDPAATRRIIVMVRKLNPGAHIIVRTRFTADVTDLHTIGADEVIPEEYETSVEIFARVLDRYMIPDDQIEEFIDQIRSENYEMLRRIPGSRLEMEGLKSSLSEVEISRLRVREYSKIIGKSLGGYRLAQPFRGHGTRNPPGRRNHSQPGRRSGHTGRGHPDTAWKIG